MKESLSQYHAVTANDMGLARERRVDRQRVLMREFGAPLICLTMNVAGEIKYTPLIADGFHEAVSLIQRQLSRHGAQVLHEEISEEYTGCEAYISVNADAIRIKKLMCQIEDADAFGRLLDIDVMDSRGKLTRLDIGLANRKCLLCENDAMLCARSRTHSAGELFAETERILIERRDAAFAERVAELAVRALLFEVAATPKPGLVDLNNTGAHSDMDVFSFLSSAASLHTYFAQCASTGLEAKSPEAAFIKLRYHGMLAEDTMLKATGGVNTHKGAIFTMGIFCCALGLQRGEAFDARIVCKLCGDMTRKALETEPRTGARFEVSRGLPSVCDIALPALNSALDMGCSLNDACVYALIALIAHVEDANVIRRSSKTEAGELREKARILLDDFSIAGVRELDAYCIRENISPGGCADLIAIALLSHFINEEGLFDKRANSAAQAPQNPSCT